MPYNEADINAPVNNPDALQLSVDIKPNSNSSEAVSHAEQDNQLPASSILVQPIESIQTTPKVVPQVINEVFIRNKHEMAKMLLNAAEQGDLDTVQRLLLEGGAEIYEKDDEGNTALLWAAGGGHLPVVRWLLQKGGAAITEKDYEGNTALLWSAWTGHLPVVQWLLQEGGATISEKDAEGYTALLCAALNGELPVVQWLLQEGGATITEKDEEGNTALLCAALNGNIDMVQWLLQEGGAAITEKNNHGHTALVKAGLNDNLDVVLWWLEAGEAVINKRDGITALLCAAWNGKLDVVQGLLQEGGAAITEKNNRGNTALLFAAFNGKLDVVQWLLQEGGAAITEKDDGGHTALLWAADHGHLPVVQWLLQEGGATISEKDEKGNTALLCAAWNGELDMVQHLLQEGGAAITEKNNCGNTALLNAAGTGKLDVVQWLLQEGGATITEKDEKGNTALLLAAGGGHLPLVRWLLQEGGATICEKDEKGNTVLLCAAWYGELDVVEWLLQEGGATVTEKNDDGLTALLCSACNGQLPVVQWLLQEGGATVTEKDNCENTALLLSAWKGELDVVEWLLQEGGATVTERDEGGFTALLCAAGGGNLLVVQWLLQKGGATISEKDEEGYTALLRAAWNGKLDVVQWLLQKGGATISEKDEDGYTALLCAALRGHLPVVQWMLQEGWATITERNNNGNTALRCAAATGHLPVVQWLLQEGGATVTERDKEGVTPLLCAANCGQIPVVQWLLQKGGATITEKDDEGHTALLRAALCANLPIVKWLLQEGGATISEKDVTGSTALLLASAYGKLDVVQWLLQKGGATITEKNNNGHTALLCAAGGGNLPVVQWLLQEGGAAISEKNNNGHTALLRAALWGNLPVLQWLLQEGGATIREQDAEGNTVLQLAASKGWQPLVNWLLIEWGFVFTPEEIRGAVEICFKINLSLLTNFYKFLSTNSSLPLIECVPLTQILAYSGEEKALLLDKSLSLLVSLFELPQKKALGMALYQLHGHELKPLLNESQQQIIERVSSELNTAHDFSEGFTETPSIPLISLPDLTNKQDPYIALDKEAMIPMVEDYYSGEDIDLLIKALLKQHHVVIEKDYSLAKRNDKGSDLEELAIYVLPATSKNEGLGYLEHLIKCIASGQVEACQVLIPYKVSNFAHWVSILVHYQTNKFSVTVYDSLANQKTADDTMKEMVNFIEPLTNAKVFINPLQKLKKIQKGNNYCGGYTAHVIAEAAMQPSKNSNTFNDLKCIDEFYNSPNNDLNRSNNDFAYRQNDARIVGIQKPKGYQRYALSGDGHQTPEKRVQSEQQEKEVHHCLAEEFTRRFNNLSQENKNYLSEKWHHEKNDIVHQLNATEASHKAAIKVLSSYRYYCSVELTISIDENPFALFFKQQMNLQSIEIDEDITSLDLWIKEKLVTFCLVPSIGELIQTTPIQLDEGNTTANDSHEESTQTTLETQEYTKKSTAKRTAKDLKRQKLTAENPKTSHTEPDYLQMIFERAKNMASQLTCEGRFFLTKETLEQLPAEERVKQLIVELEKAWELATKKDHPTGAEKNKEQLLIELQDFYYSLQKKPAINSPCFFQLFEEKVKAQPTKLAVIYDATTLSYQELNEKANRLAHYLIDLKKEKNWTNGTCIALFFENSIDAIISILAVMKAGLAYLPLTIDKHLSNERLTAYVEESGVTWLLVQDSLAHHGFIHFVKNKIDSLESQIFSHCQHKNKKNPALKIAPHQLAYTIFSSGSTGKPKGIPIAHGGLVNPIKAVEQAFQITANDRVGWHALLSFDASLLDIMTALGTGSTSVIIPQAIRTDGEKLTTYLQTHEVSIITLVPTVLETLNPASLPKLRGYISTGEAGKKGLFDYWHQTGRLQDQEPRIGLNGHGPTETSICFALGRYQIDRPMTPIGEIIVPGFEWFIMKLPSETCPYPRKPFPVTEGEEGELYLAGPGLGLGYIDTKAPYQQRFRTIFHPHQPNKLIRIYQTGDVVRWTNNALYYERRMDEQYKFLGELLHPVAIEEAIQGYKSNNTSILENVKVVVEEPKDGLPFLCVYLKERVNESIDEQWVRHIVLNLKHHAFCTFVPSRFIVVKEWPVNANGKLEVGKLPQQVKKTYFSGSALGLLPSKGIEEVCAEIWQDVLNIPKDNYSISLDDNFNELGGDSIRTDRLLEKVRQVYPNYVKNIAQFAAYPTLRALVFRVRLANKEVKQEVVQLIKGTFNPSVSEQQFPVILIHSVMGDPAADYRHLIAHWQHAMGNRPLFGLRSPSLYEPGYAVSSIEELAFDYINYLTESLAGYQGPLIFIGYSAGGTIAYEMARQLQISKRAVAVYCIDTPSVAYYQGLSPEHYATEIFELMQHAGARVMGLDPNHGISLTTLQQYTKQEQLTIYWRQMVEKCAHLPEGERQKNQGIYATLHNAIPGQLEYELKPIENWNLLAFSDTQQNKCRGDTSLGWGDQFSINIITIAGKHLNLVDESSWVKETIMPRLQTFCEQAQISLINMQSTLSMLPTLRALKDQMIRQYSTLKFSSPKRISVKEGYVPAQLKGHGKTVVVNRLAPLFSSDSNPILLVGDNGAGKTSILKFIKSQWAGDKGSERIFTLILEPKLQHFSNKRFKTKSAIEFQLEMVLKTSFSSHYQFHEDIKEEGKLLNVLRLNEKEVLILLDNYEKITDDSYSTLQRIIKYLIKKTSFQILLTSSVHAAPHYFFKTQHSIFTVEPWTDQQRQLFARQHYNNEVENQVIIESEFSLFLNNPRYLRLYCDKFRGPQRHNNNPGASNLVYFLEQLELSQWLRYFKKEDTQKRKREAKVPFDSLKLNILSLTTFRKMCETEFEFIKKQAKKCLSKDALLFDDLYLDSLDRTSLSLSSRSATEGDPLHGVVRTGFIKALVLEGQPSNQYQFQNILFRDYFYALSWVDDHTSTIEEDRNNAKHELEAHLYNPSYKIIWSLVTGLLAKSEHKDKFKPFIDRIFSEQVFGSYPYFLQAACLQEAKMALSVYYDNTVKQMAQLLKNQMARLDDDYSATKAESSLIIQLLRQYPLFLNEPAIADVLKKDGRLNYSSQLIELCKEKVEKEKSIGHSISSYKKEMKDLPTDKKSIVNLLKSNNDLSSYFHSFKDNFLIDIMKKTKSIHVLTRACNFISRSCCESNQKTMNLLLDEIKNQHQIRINKKTSTFSYDRGLSKRERQLYLILESYYDERTPGKDINKLIDKLINSENDRPRTILFLSLIDYSEYLDTLDLNPFEPEEIPIVLKSTANPLFNLLKKFVNNNEKLLKLVPLIVEYLQEKGLTLYFQDDKSLVLMDGERKEVYVVQRPEQLKNSIRDLYNSKSEVEKLNSATFSQSTTTEVNKLSGEVEYKQGMEWLKTSRRKALSCFESAVQMNYPAAYLRLGILYAEGGKGIPKDKIKSEVYYKEAATHIEWFKNQAESGLEDAQCNLGLCYDKGLGVDEDEEKAVQYYQKAADQGHAGAQCILGLCYAQGHGIPKDVTKAKEYLNKAANQNYAQAQGSLGLFYSRGIGVRKNIDKAVEYYQKAANQGYADAQNNLGICYVTGQGVTTNDKKAVKYYQKAADQGDAQARFNLGICYKEGLGVPKDKIIAFGHFHQAANQGHATSQYFLGIYYAEGKDIPKDEIKALEYLQKAAGQGNKSAQNFLHSRSNQLVGTNKGNCAAEYYQKAADEGCARAQYILGGFYAKGEVVPKDEIKAIEYYQKAANQRDPGAQYHLGACYEKGLGIPKDEIMAAKYYQKAAYQGHAAAQYYLGICYYKGLGVPQNALKAQEYIRQADDQGYLKTRYFLQSASRDEKNAIEHLKGAAQGLPEAMQELEIFTKNQTNTIPLGTSMNFFKVVKLVINSDDEDAEKKSLSTSGSVQKL